MGKKGGSDGSNEAAQARADEQARQQRIRQGTQRINSIFDGSTVGDGALTAGAAYDPSKTYYNKDGSVWSPSAGGSGGGSSGASAPAGGSIFSGGVTPPTGGTQPSKMFSGGITPPTGGTQPSKMFSGGVLPPVGGAGASYGGGKFIDGNYYAGGPAPSSGGQPQSSADQFAEALAGGSLYGGTKQTGGFNDDFFNARRQAFINYAQPQLQDQFAGANKELTYALARGGNLNSSARSSKSADLQKLYDTNTQQVADQALSYETQSRNAVEDARSNLISTLNATGDAEGAASSALARATALSQQPAYSPLGQLFTDFTAGLGTQAALERSASVSGGAYTPRYNTGLFGNAGRVTVSK